MNDKDEKDAGDQNGGGAFSRTLSCDVLVYGGTVSGIAAAVAAARKGCKTYLIERGNHFGGMTASGLGVIDTMREEAFGGILEEFLKRVRTYYLEQYGADSDQYDLTYGGYFMEPKVAEAILNDMLAAEDNLETLDWA